MDNDYSNDYTKEEIFEILKSDNSDDFKKIFALIELDTISNQEEFNILINNLTNRPSPLREAVAIKLSEIKNPDYFLDSFAQNQILKGIIDINPNVSREICGIILNNKALGGILEEKIIENIFNLLKEFENLNKEQIPNTAKKNHPNHSINTKNSHAKNKKLFSLYWLLESLSCCLSEKYNSKALEIAKITINFNDYTIREKTAKILKKTGKLPDFFLEKMKQEQNFYVKYQVYDKITMT